ncbi:MAG: DUF484 family protein [Gammaproteobacteria bacterium]
MSEAELCSEDSERISAEQVHSYLADHPDFFVEHEKLLEVLSVPHPTGAAISLIERQLAIYRDKNKKLQQQLNNLLRIARDNEQLLHRMHKLTLALLDAEDLEGAIAALQGVLHEQFKVEYVAVRIVRNKSSAALAELFVPVSDPRLRSFRNIFASRRPKSGAPTIEQASFLFGDNAPEIRSCAIIPFFPADTVGILGIGSQNRKRFLPTMGHLFLTRIGEMIGYRLGPLIGSPNKETPCPPR